MVKKITFLFLISCSLLSAQQGEIVPLIKGDYRLYHRYYETYDANHNYRVTYNLYRGEKVIGDTVINSRKYAKISIIEYKENSQPVYVLRYSDSKVYLNYWPANARYDTVYNANIIESKQLHGEYVPTQGYVSEYLSIGIQPIFNLMCKTQTFQFSSNHSQSDRVYSERFGLVYSSSYYDGIPDRTSIIGAKIDGVYYGKPAPPLNARIKVQDRVLNLKFDLYDSTRAIEKIIIYKSDSDKNYKRYDSVYTSLPQYSKKLNAGNYDIKFSYYSGGMESMLSDGIAFEVIPVDFKIYQNYPNPFNGQTKIPFETKFSADFELVIYNALGQTVYTDKFKTPGGEYYEFVLDLMNLPSGVYLYMIKTIYDRMQFNKMLMVK